MAWKEKGQQFFYGIINPAVKLLIKMGVTPNQITFVGLLLNILAALIFIYGAEHGGRNDYRYLGWGGFVILIAGLMDMVDGRLARLGNMSSKYGALYDSVLDRYSELFMFFGICYYLIAQDYLWSSIFAFFAMMGSIMVSYTRARAEALGADCGIGLMQRPERIIIIGGSAVLCGIVSHFIGNDFKIDVNWLPIPLFETISIFTFPLFLLAIGTNITAIRRLRYAKDQLV